MKIKNKNIRNKTGTLIFIAFFALVSVLVPTKKAKAIPSWPDVINAFIDTGLEEIAVIIKGAIMSALKQAAAETINSTVNSLVSGTSQAGALFITDWEDYLVSGPMAETSLMMNDFFGVTLRGRSSRSNYISECADVNKRSYYNNMRAQAEKATKYIDIRGLQSDFEDFACDGVQMFEKGTWQAFDAFLKPMNNVMGYTLTAQGYQMTVEERLKEEARVKAIANNAYVSLEKDGKVITPGSTIKELQAQAMDVGNKILAAAEHPGEVITAVVSKIATDTIKSGIGNAQRNIQKNINSSICNGVQSVRDDLKSMVPEVGSSGYGRSSSGHSVNSNYSTCKIK